MPCRLYDDNLALYGKRYFYFVWELPLFALMGAIAGLLGALFIHLNIKATALRARYIPPRKPGLRLLEVRQPLSLCTHCLIAWTPCGIDSESIPQAPCEEQIDTSGLKWNYAASCPVTEAASFANTA